MFLKEKEKNNKASLKPEFHIKAKRDSSNNLLPLQESNNVKCSYSRQEFV